MRFLIFFLFNVLTLNANVYLVFAKAPNTPKILFTSVKDGINRHYGVYLMNPDGSDQVNLTHHRSNDQSAVWSPTGEQILFVSDRDGVRDLYLMDPDGSNVRRVFKKEAERQHPSWSPDGKQIAYTHMRWDKDRYPIYIATLGEQEEEELGVDGLFAVWSPDGTEIAYSFGRITFLNVQTGKEKRLLPRKVAGHQIRASWSSDRRQNSPFLGIRIHYQQTANPVIPFPPGWADKKTIYIVNRDGTDLRQLVDEAGTQGMVSSVIAIWGYSPLYTRH